ncbi:MAG: hypothetical protein P9L89_06330 [Candidatus Celaenobacter polaris]|nr:hypothetical protein [Candidatus Celaenobacter polaris]
MKSITYLFSIIMLFIAINACSILQPYSIRKIAPSIPEQYREKVLESLEEAGSNKKELLKVLYHYKEDHLKLQAASFLIAYMPDHCFADVSLVDSLGNTVAMNVMDFNTAMEVQAYIDSLETQIGELRYKLIEKREDVKTMYAELLITHIDAAFRAYEILPWTNQYSWEDFREYILPYRGSSEPISDWRSYFWEVFASSRDSIQDPLELAYVINDSSMKMFTFKDIFYYHSADQGLAEMLENKIGRCEDMTNFSIYAMRANGLAVTSDFTPYWPDRSNNHAWNAIILPNEEVIPFMGCEANPGKYNLQKRIAKVYRKLFSQELGTLADILPDSIKAPPWLGYKNFKDVTDKYRPVSDVTLQVNQDKPFAYIAVFNDNKWQPIHWGSVDSTGVVVFSDMGRDIAYIPVFYEIVDTIMVEDKEKPKYEPIPAGAPFILSEEGNVIAFDNEAVEIREEINNEFIMRKTGQGGINKVKIDSTYTWFVWAEDEWREVIDTTVTADSLVFEYYYPESLYKVEEDCLHPDPRIFTVENGEVIFW